MQEGESVITRQKEKTRFNFEERHGLPPIVGIESRSHQLHVFLEHEADEYEWIRAYYHERECQQRRVARGDPPDYAVRASQFAYFERSLNRRGIGVRPRLPSIQGLGSDAERDEHETM